MKNKLTLQEKLRDLREERKMTLSDLAEAIGIPLSTLQRLEGNDDVRVGYQDIATLARFYDVSADYLFGLTDNKQYRNVEIDKLGLSDEAIEVLNTAKANNRLISEFISHPDFLKLMSSMEIYIDRKVLPQMNMMNAMYSFAEKSIKDNFEVVENDEMLALLHELTVDEDDYLRHRISERFNNILKSLFEAHKKDVEPDYQTDIIKEMQSGVSDHIANSKTERKRMEFWAKNLGLDIKDLSDEELKVLTKALDRSSIVKRYKKRISR